MSDERVDAIKAEVRRFEVERDIFNRSLQLFLEWHLRNVIDVHLAAQCGANFPHCCFMIIEWRGMQEIFLVS
jgi:hypothetical protein